MNFSLPDEGFNEEEIAPIAGLMTSALIRPSLRCPNRFPSNITSSEECEGNHILFIILSDLLNPLARASLSTPGEAA